MDFHLSEVKATSRSIEGRERVEWSKKDVGSDHTKGHSGPIGWMDRLSRLIQPGVRIICNRPVPPSLARSWAREWGLPGRNLEENRHSESQRFTGPGVRGNQEREQRTDYRPYGDRKD